MGESESKATVLECMIKIFKKGFGGDYGMKQTHITLPTKVPLVKTALLPWWLRG